MHPQFVLGVIISEGCFTVNLRESANGLGLTCRFQLKMSNDDREIVESIQQELGDVGGLYGEEKEKWSDTIALIVTSNDEISELIEYIETNRTSAFNKTRKATQFEKWKDCVNVDSPIENDDKMIEIIKKAKDIGKYNRGVSAEEWISRVVEEE